jgi:PAS domain S-box-containing protein
MTDADRTKDQLTSELVEMRRRIAKLEGSERKYRLITENSSDYISLITLKGIYTYVSPSVRQLGYEPEELLGKSGLDMVHPDDRKRLIPLLTTYARMKIRDLLRLKKQNISEQISFRFPNKSGRWHYTTWRPLRTLLMPPMVREPISFSLLVTSPSTGGCRGNSRRVKPG